jgi:hypothetical protein
MPNPFKDWGRMYRSNQQSSVLRIQGRVQREDGTVPYIAVFDEVVAPLHIARTQPGTVTFVSPRVHRVGP